MKQNPSGITFVRNLGFFLIFVALMFALRSLWTYPIEHSDAIQKYFYSVEILRSGDWSILLTNHHTMRWAAMLPQIGLTWLVGIRYEVFFILPLLTFSLYLALIVFSLKKFLNFSQQLLLGTVLFIEPMSFHTSNQYFVTGIGVFCAFAGIMVLVHQGKRQNLATMFAALLFFVAYGAHVTYLSFAAGSFLWLALFQRKPSRAVIFALTILFLMVFETLFFNYLSEWQLALGRIEALAHGKHVGRAITDTPVTFDQLLLRWLDLPPPHLLLSLGFIVAGAWLIVQKRLGRHIPGLIECTFMVGLCFAIAVTFAVYGIDPLKPVMPLRPRYLIPFFPFASVLIVYALSVFASNVVSKANYRKILAVSLCFTVFLLVFPTYQIDFFRSKFDAFMWKSDREYSEYSERFRDGELILRGKKKLSYGMIARFKHPVDIHNRKTGVSVLNPSSEAKCVDQLNRSPLYLNYKECGY